MAEWLVAAALLALLLYFIAPQQLPVIAYKALLVTGFGFLGYWLDRRLFWYSRPGDNNGAFEASCQLRRAIVVAAVVIAGALAL